MKLFIRIGILSACFLGCILAYAQEETEEESKDGDVWSASLEGDVETLKQLLEEGADLNAARPGESDLPLMLAVRGRHSEAAKWLIDNGADVNKRDMNGNTAAIAAAFYGFSDMFQILVDAEADASLQNYEGQDVAAILGTPWEVTNYIANDLLQLGLEAKDVEAGRNEIRQELAKASIWIAVEVGNADLVSEHLKKGTDASSVEPLGGASLLLAATIASHADIVKVLVEAGAELDAQQRDNGVTALQVAAFLGHEDIAKILMDAGADTGIMDYQGSGVADMLELSYGETMSITSLLGIPLKDEEALTASRKAIGEMLEPEEESEEE